MIKDLRKKFNKIAIKTNPSDCKSKDLHLLLSDYLYKELKSEGINVKRNNVNLIIGFKNNTKLIIDCLEGHLYMDNKSIGKLRRFNMSRSGEAYDCAVQNAKRIINKIKSIQNQINNDNVIFKKASLKDMRKVSITDMRKIAQITDLRIKKKIIDTIQASANDFRKTSSIKDLRRQADIVGDRECAIVVINNSEILEDNTHAAAISKYLTQNGADELNEQYYRVQTYDLETSKDSLEQRLNGASESMKNSIEDAINIQENITSLAFAHKMKDYTIRLETDTLWNCDAKSTAYLLKDHYRDYDILDDCSMEEKKIAKIKDLRKKVIAIADFRQEKLIYRKDMRR